MTETVTSRDSTSMSRDNHRHRRAMLPARRFALGVATGLVLAASLLAVCTACGGEGEYITGGEQIDRITVTDQLYLEKDGTKYEISVGKDDVVTATRVGK